MNIPEFRNLHYVARHECGHYANSWTTLAIRWSTSDQSIPRPNVTIICTQSSHKTTSKSDISTINSTNKPIHRTTARGCSCHQNSTSISV